MCLLSPPAAYLEDGGRSYLMRLVTIYQTTRCHTEDDSYLHYLHHMLQKYLKLSTTVFLLQQNYIRKHKVRDVLSPEDGHTKF
jgi:phage tail sheath gpL-like